MHNPTLVHRCISGLEKKKSNATKIISVHRCISGLEITKKGWSYSPKVHRCISGLETVPPSKKKDDSLYDDRLLRILNLANELLIPKYRFDVKDIIIQNESYEPSHKSSKRPSSQELKARYRLDNINSVQLREKIIIFDDVLTMGSHFKAIKSLLHDVYPQKKIYGLFIARSIYPPITDNFENLTKQY